MCGSHNLKQVWSFGETPLANEYVMPFDMAQGKPKEPFAPLDVYKCEDCHLVQMCDVVDPEVLFGDYLYVSSTSSSFVAHFEDYAKHLIERFELTDKDLVIDVGSNDGVLLKPFQAAGVRVLGIEPAQNIAAQANLDGVETVSEFITVEGAKMLAQKHGKARVVTANNVFAHTDDVGVFTSAVKELLTNDGVFVFEVQYLKSLIEKNLFDIVYHEHVCYYHVHPLVNFFEKHGMEVFDVEQPEVHGGSIRVYVQLQGGGHEKTQQLADVLEEEEKEALNDVSTYELFMQRIERNKQDLMHILENIKKSGKRVVGYGAPAKATTLMYAFGLGGDVIDYVVDDAVMKQGRLMPGTHIPIVSSEQLYKDKPDYCLILAWNFAEPIMENNKEFTKQGGQFIIPTPEPRIVENKQKD